MNVDMRLAVAQMVKASKFRSDGITIDCFGVGGDRVLTVDADGRWSIPRRVAADVRSRPQEGLPLVRVSAFLLSDVLARVQAKARETQRAAALAMFVAREVADAKRRIRGSDCRPDGSASLTRGAILRRYDLTFRSARNFETRLLLDDTPGPSCDRSRVLFRLELDLLRAGLLADEVFVLARGCAFNKFRGRRNEGEQLCRDIDRAEKVVAEERLTLPYDVWFASEGGRYLTTAREWEKALSCGRGAQGRRQGAQPLSSQRPTQAPRPARA